jgi:hypothetical protein
VGVIESLLAQKKHMQKRNMHPPLIFYWPHLHLKGETAREKRNWLWNYPKYQYCTNEHRHICSRCADFPEHIGHKHMLSTAYYAANKFPEDWRITLPLDVKALAGYNILSIFFDLQKIYIFI